MSFSQDALMAFVAAVDHGSISAGARQLGKRQSTLSESLANLEIDLGLTLFQRGSRQLTLTAEGQRLLPLARQALAQLQAAEDGLRQARQRPQGTLVVGGTPFLLQHCIVPALTSFHASYPDLTLDLRTVLHLEEAAAKDCDLLLLHGWFEGGAWVRRELPVMAQVTAATPEYWKRQGLPRHPRELADHNCLSYRNPYGKLLDLWRYRQPGPQGEVVEEVVVRGWLNSNHRDNLLALALDHGGVMRIAYATAQAELASGRLVPALLDWELMDPPPLAMYFRPELRRTLRLRVFADFAGALCTELSQMTDAKGQASVDGRPAWHQGNGRRAASWLSHHR